jgi:translation initiation factor 3 subunit J
LIPQWAPSQQTNVGNLSTGAKKKQLIVDKPDEDSFAAATYDADNDFDFM